MKILIMAQHYAPEDVSGAVLATELAEDLVERGHKVAFVTSAPSYPYGRVFPGYKNRLHSREMLNGVEIARTWSYISPDKNFWRRIFNYGTFSASALYGALLSGKPDIILSYSQPMPLGLTAWLLSRLWRVPWVLRVEDLYPDSAIAAGVIQNRLAISFLLAIERFLYGKATHISLISDGFRKRLLEKNVPADKMSVIPVWADPDEVIPLPKENEFRRAHGLENQFLVMSAGNLGETSSLEDVLAAAVILRGEPEVSFVLVGEGTKKASLMAFAEQEQLNNVIFLPYQARETYPQMMAAADLGLVTLNHSSFWTSLPSKTFNIMASERPILAITPPGSEISLLIERVCCGVNVPPEKPRILAETIMRLKDSTGSLRKMGKNGRNHLEGHYSRERCVGLFEKILHEQ